MTMRSGVLVYYPHMKKLILNFAPAAVAAACLLSATPVAVGAETACAPTAVDARDVWNLAELKKTPRTFAVEQPCSNEYGRVSGVSPIWIEGEPYRGKPTRVFAWWGLPAGASSAHKVPAMVLVHGGGGTAFAAWVKTWNDRGYAAIALDTCGKIPQGERDGRPHAGYAWSGPSGWGDGIRQMDEPPKDNWTYHAVAAIMRAHSFLRARPEVDAARVGLTGISWGGYLTSVTMGVDDRFVFAAPVYGCGWYDLGPIWSERKTHPDQFSRWLAQWDAKNFLPNTRTTVLWCCGTNDIFYPLDAVAKSCEALPDATPLLLSLKLRMPHGHPPAGDPPEIAALADWKLKGAAPLVEVKEARVEGNALHVAFDAHGRRVVRAELLATCDANPTLSKRPWTATPVAGFEASRGAFDAPLPANAVMFFANLVTDDGLVFSTAPQFGRPQK